MSLNNVWPMRNAKNEDYNNNQTNHNFTDNNAASAKHSFCLAPAAIEQEYVLHRVLLVSNLSRIVSGVVGVFK